MLAFVAINLISKQKILRTFGRSIRVLPYCYYGFRRAPRAVDLAEYGLARMQKGYNACIKPVTMNINQPFSELR